MESLKRMESDEMNKTFEGEENETSFYMPVIKLFV